MMGRLGGGVVIRTAPLGQNLDDRTVPEFQAAMNERFVSAENGLSNLLVGPGNKRVAERAAGALGWRRVSTTEWG
jgi:hypothetical protein